MLFKKEGFPEEDELVICTVTKVQFNSVFANMDEYQKQGLIHISEISPGRIRNIRDFVKEGKVIVCKVLRVNREMGQIDLSLRRVTESQKRSKVEEMKQEKKVEKILEFIALSLKKDKLELYNEVFSKINKKYIMLNHAFQAVAEGELSLEKLGIDKKVATLLEKEITDRMKPGEVEIAGNLTLRSFEPNGVDIVKEAISKALISDKVKVSYLGGAKYHIHVAAPDYLEAEELMKKATDGCIDYVKQHKSEGSFARTEE